MTYSSLSTIAVHNSMGTGTASEMSSRKSVSHCNFERGRRGRLITKQNNSRKKNDLKDYQFNFCQAAVLVGSEERSIDSMNWMM